MVSGPEGTIVWLAQSLRRVLWIQAVLGLTRAALLWGSSQGGLVSVHVDWRGCGCSVCGARRGGQWFLCTHAGLHCWGDPAGCMRSGLVLYISLTQANATLLRHCGVCSAISVCRAASHPCDHTEPAGHGASVIQWMSAEAPTNGASWQDFGREELQAARLLLEEESQVLPNALEQQHPVQSLIRAPGHPCLANCLNLVWTQAGPDKGAPWCARWS